MQKSKFSRAVSILLVLCISFSMVAFQPVTGIAIENVNTSVSMASDITAEEAVMLAEAVEPAIEDDFSSTEVLVVVKESHSQVNKPWAAADFGNANIISVRDITKLDTAKLDITEYLKNVSFRQILQLKLKTTGKQKVLDAIDAIKELDFVLSAEPNYYMDTEAATPSATPNDKFFVEGKQWNLENANVIAAWQAYSPDAGSVKVGVIDSGIATHDDLDDNTIIGYDGWNYSTVTNDDLAGHGTHVAGIIGAVGNNTIGIAGIAQKVQLVPLQAAMPNKQISTDAMMGCLTYAVNNDIPIVNASFGSYNDYSIAEKASIQNYPGLFVTAAGNDATNTDITPHYPSCFGYPNIINVANINSGNNLSATSNYGASSVDIAAPGTSIPSTYPTTLDGGTGYYSMGGTSMAAPHVAGVAALIKAHFPNATTAQIKAAILNSAAPVSALNGKVATGGKLDALGALNAMANIGASSFTITFNANGGTGSMPSQTVAAFAPADLNKSLFTNAGYVFLGWSTSPTGSVSYLDEQTVTASSSMNLYAVWAPVIPLATGVMTANGYNHTLALKQDGTVWAWGDNTLGQLGTGVRQRPSEAPTTNPVQIPTLSNVKAISAGMNFSVALKNDGTVWAWGENKYGKVGVVTPSSDEWVSTPKQIPGLTNIIAISAGADYTIALKSDGTVYGFGDNWWGQLGNNASVTNDIGQPTVVQMIISDVKAIAAGYNSPVMLKNDGTVWTCGKNSFGQLGHGTMGSDVYVPAQVTAIGSDIAAIGSALNHAIAIKDDGSVWSWGQNQNGALGYIGNNGTASKSITPSKIFGPGEVDFATGGDAYTLLRRKDGTVWALGSNIYGQQGSDANGQNIAQNPSPLKMNNISGAIFVSGNFDNTSVILADGTVWCVGRNSSGQIGNGLTQGYIQAVNQTVLANGTAFNVFGDTLPTFAITATAATGGAVTGGGTVTQGSLVTLTAAPDSDYTFDGWYEGAARVSTGAVYSFTATANRTLEARFTAVQKFTITATAATGGAVTGGCTVNEGALVTLTAAPDADYNFDGWYEGAARVSTSVVYSFTATANRTLEARFIAIKFEITSVDVAGTPSIGNELTFTAHAKDGYGTLKYAFYVLGGGKVHDSLVYSDVSDYHYTPTTAGTYTLRVYCIDENKNMVAYSEVFTVS
ncbi:MAG: S8 family serine peptidase [Oscillospiraceae bacterium]|jgi:uncharacterized repeat protein (TIGR02543 family)|nr:S8 family serine peptidase [Oscillospiraceae bacterium]